MFVFQAHDLQNMRERVDWSKTCQGKYFNFLGHFFTLYCVWKIFISTVNIVFDRVGKVDPISKTFDILINWFGFNIDVAMWSQQFSFIVVGIIVVTSTRGLLLTMSKFFIWISSSKSSNVLVLFFSQIMGMYFMSMVVLMRMNMPPEYRAIITSVLGDLQFNFYHRYNGYENYLTLVRCVRKLMIEMLGIIPLKDFGPPPKVCKT